MKPRMKPRILIVDNVASVRDAYAALVDYAGYQAIRADGKEQDCCRRRGERPDVFLC